MGQQLNSTLILDMEKRISRRRSFNPEILRVYYSAGFSLSILLFFGCLDVMDPHTYTSPNQGNALAESMLSRYLGKETVNYFSSKFVSNSLIIESQNG